jgi:hypothetical protein
MGALPTAPDVEQHSEVTAYAQWSRTLMRKHALRKFWCFFLVHNKYKLITLHLCTFVMIFLIFKWSSPTYWTRISHQKLNLGINEILTNTAKIIFSHATWHRNDEPCSYTVLWFTAQAICSYIYRSYIWTFPIIENGEHRIYIRIPI